MSSSSPLHIHQIYRCHRTGMNEKILVIDTPKEKGCHSQGA